MLTTKQIGKSRTIAINYANSQTLSKLAIIELTKKIEFLNKNPTFTPLNKKLMEIESTFTTIIDAQKNFNLNRIELLILTQEPASAIKKCKQIEKKFEIKIDCLSLRNKEFIKILKTNNLTITQMLSNKIILAGQEAFFSITGSTLNDNPLLIRNYSLTDLSENELRHNLAKFGYSEFGNESDSKELSIEETIAATLINGSARQKTALNEIMKKNQLNPPLLSFLTKKYSKEQELLKILSKSNSNNINELKSILTIRGD
jgi:hypothetical protein